MPHLQKGEKIAVIRDLLRQVQLVQEEPENGQDSFCLLDPANDLSTASTERAR